MAIRWLTLAASRLNGCLEIDGQFTSAGLIERLYPANRFIQHTKLILAPVWFAGDAAEIAFIIRAPRSFNAVREVTVD